MSTDLIIEVKVGNLKSEISPKLNEKQIDELLTKYLDFTTKFSALELKDIDYLSPTILRDRYSSNLQKFFLLVELIALAKKENMPSFILSLPSHKWIRILQNWTSAKLKVSTKQSFKLCINSYKESFKLYKNFLGNLLILSLKNFIFTKETLIGFQPEFIIIAPIHGEGNEPYFKKLISYCISENKKILILGPSVSGKTINYKISDTVYVDSLNFPIPFIEFLSLIFKMVTEFFRRIKNNKQILNRTEFDLFLEDWKASSVTRSFGHLQILQFKTFFKRYPEAKIFQTFEGNSWEKTIKIALNALKDKRKVVGYLHCAVLKSHTKLITTGNEFFQRYFPDTIFCTGRKAKEVLLQIGDYPKEKIQDGWALREGYLKDIPITSIPNNKIALVMLEGLETMRIFLKSILDSEKIWNRYKLVVRTHPTLKLDSPTFHSLRSHHNFTKLEESSIKSLVEDISRSDLVIYQGTTASLYAAYLGRPLLRFKTDWWLTDDPLCGLPTGLIPHFSNSEDLDRELLTNFRERDLDSHTTMMLRHYVSEYIKDPEESDIKAFLNFQILNYE
jgi:hypothetical protein